MRSVPFFLGTTTMELIQGVGSVTGARISCVTRSSRVALRLSLNGTGTRRGECCTGSMFGSNRHPITENLEMLLDKLLWGHWAGVFYCVQCFQP